MRKNTRRLLALVALVAIFSGLEPLRKLLIAAPCLVALLIEWDFFSIYLAELERERIGSEDGIEY